MNWYLYNIKYLLIRPHKVTQIDIELDHKSIADEDTSNSSMMQNCDGEYKIVIWGKLTSLYIVIKQDTSAPLQHQSENSVWVMSSHIYTCITTFPKQVTAKDAFSILKTITTWNEFAQQTSEIGERTDRSFISQGKLRCIEDVNDNIDWRQHWQCFWIITLYITPFKNESGFSKIEFRQH